MSIRIGPSQRTVKSIFKVEDMGLSVILYDFPSENALNCAKVLLTISFFNQTYIDCLHIKKTDKSRLHIEDSMDTDNTDASKSSEDHFVREKVCLNLFVSLGLDFSEILLVHSSFLIAD